jgi:hypothetical protein
MSNNIKLAHTYAKQQANMLTADGVWISDNLPMLSRSERKAVLKAYKKYFKTVDYDTATGVCKCSNKDNTEVKQNGNWFVSTGEGGDMGQGVKATNMPKISGNVVLGKLSDLL